MRLLLCLQVFPAQPSPQEMIQWPALRQPALHFALVQTPGLYRSHVCLAPSPCLWARVRTQSGRVSDWHLPSGLKIKQAGFNWCDEQRTCETFHRNMEGVSFWKREFGQRSSLFLGTWKNDTLTTWRWKNYPPVRLKSGDRHEDYSIPFYQSLLQSPLLSIL